MLEGSNAFALKEVVVSEGWKGGWPLAAKFDSKDPVACLVALVERGPGVDISWVWCGDDVIESVGEHLRQQSGVCQVD